MTEEVIIFDWDAAFKEKVRQFKADMHDFYRKIGEEPTPRLDGAGRKIVEKRPDGKDYIIEAYMRKKLDQYFPGWTWEMAAPLHFLGAEWVVAQGHLCIVDEHLLAFGIRPPVRKFYGVDSVRIQYRRDATHEATNIVDVGDNCKQANSAAFKYAINRLTNIGDDIYGKRIDEEGAGSAEDIIMTSSNAGLVMQQVMEYCQKRKILVSKMCQILGVEKVEQVTDWKVAFEKIKAATGG